MHRRLMIWFRALRPFSFPISALPALIALFLTPRHNGLHMGVAIGVIALVLSFHAAGNLINDYYDVARGVDSIRNDAGRPGRLLLEGEISRRGVLFAIIVCLGLGLVLGSYLIWTCDVHLIWFIIAAILGLYAYTGPPFYLKYRAAGEPLVFLIFGPVLMTGTAYAVAGRLVDRVVSLSIPVGLGITSILIVNNIRDWKEDRKAGIRTLPHVIGRRPAILLHIASVSGFVVGLSLLGWLGTVPEPIIVIPLGLVFHFSTIKSVWHGTRTADVDVKTAQFVSIILAYVLSCIIISRFQPLSWLLVATH